MNDVDEVRRMLAPVLEGDTGPRYSPEEVLKSARKATTQRRAVVASTLSVALVLAVGASVVLAVTGRSTVESAASSPVPSPPSDRQKMVLNPHAGVLTEKLATANVIPAGFEITTTVSDADFPPLHFHGDPHSGVGGYRAGAVFTDAAGAATLTLRVRQANSPEECRSAGDSCLRDDAALVSPRDLPILTTVDGVQVRRENHFRTDLPGLISVGTQFPDGTVVSATIRTEIEFEFDGNRWFGASGRDRVPFTERQLVDLVTKPGFTILP